MLERVLRKWVPHIGGKVEDIQKNIYDMRVIYSDDLAYVINRESILHKKIIFSIKDVPPNLLFEQVLTQLMACQGFPPFLGTNYSEFLHFQRQCGRSVLYEKYSIESIYD